MHFRRKSACGAVPGCGSNIIAADPKDADALWITEVWDDKTSHAASLELPAVQAAIAKGRPLIAGFSDRVRPNRWVATGYELWSREWLQRAGMNARTQEWSDKNAGIALL